MTTILANTCATGYGLIDEKFVEKVCQVLEIKPQCLIKPKQIQEFNDRAAKPITYAIYLILTIGTHTESLAPLLITKLENHLMMLGRLWMKKHEIIIDMTNDSLAFWPGHCTPIGAFCPTTLSQSTLPTEIAVVRIEKKYHSSKDNKERFNRRHDQFLASAK